MSSNDYAKIVKSIISNGDYFSAEEIILNIKNNLRVLISEDKIHKLFVYELYDISQIKRENGKYKYKLKELMEEIDVIEISEKLMEVKEEQIELLEENDLIANTFRYDGECVFEALRFRLKKEYLNLEIENEAVKNIVFTITRDNKISKIEEKFLKQKLSEFGLSHDFLEIVKKGLNENNPYLDNILKVIFQDRKITRQEILFLYEKVFEQEINKEATIRRFWQIGLLYYPTTFLQNDNFKMFLKLEYLVYNLSVDSEPFFHYPDLFGIEDFNDIFKKPIESLKVKILRLVRKRNSHLDESSIDTYLSLLKINKINDLEIDEKQIDERNVELDKIVKILNEEKSRIGTPDAALFCENIKFRLGI